MATLVVEVVLLMHEAVVAAVAHMVAFVQKPKVMVVLLRVADRDCDGEPQVNQSADERLVVGHVADMVHIQGGDD